MWSTGRQLHSWTAHRRNRATRQRLSSICVSKQRKTRGSLTKISKEKSKITSNMPVKYQPTASHFPISMPRTCIAKARRHLMWSDQQAITEQHMMRIIRVMWCSNHISLSTNYIKTTTPWWQRFLRTTRRSTGFSFILRMDSLNRSRIESRQHS